MSDRIVRQIQCLMAENNLDKELSPVCVTLTDGTNVSAFRSEILDEETGLSTISFFNSSGDITLDVDDWEVGACDCSKNRIYIDTCFLPDQYAVQWAWNGSGLLQSYDPITGIWTTHGTTVDPNTTLTVGGYALAFKNDAVEQTLFFQTDGKLYKASPDDPIGTFQFVGNTLPAGPSSYPCFTFDPSGRLLAGIASGSTVIEINPTTGAATNIGQLIDVRDGAALQAGPGDWYFDPNGDWFLMARDTRWATFAEPCGGTVLWKIDPSTLETVRISDSCAPVNGTGAEWLSAGQSLLSTASTDLYIYNSYTDSWALFGDPANGTMNDLSGQWIVPDPIRVIGYVEVGCDLESDNPCQGLELYTIIQDPDTFEFLCQPFEIQLPGKFGVCESEPNPFVSDPFSPSSGGGSGCDRCSDEVWHSGCSDAGTTLWRNYFDASGNSVTEYIYGSLSEPTSLEPSNFSEISCDDQPLLESTVTQFCNLDNTPNTTVFRKEYVDGVIVWFDETGTIAEPTNVSAGDCPDQDPLLSATEEIVCYDGMTYVRVVKETYIENPTTGLPELSFYQIVYYNEDGILYDSSILPAGSDPVGEPEGWYLGDCASQFIDFQIEKLCEIDSQFILLVDSGGEFAKLSLNDGSVTPVAIPVPSAGTGADIDNFLLYAITSADTLLTIDVNTNTQISDIPLFTNDSSVIGSASASFDNFNNRMLYWDYGTDSVYQVNTSTAEVSYFSGPFTGVAGFGSSFAVNPVDGKFYVSGSSAQIFEIPNGSGATGSATLVFDGSTCANGMTFDANGILYLGCSSAISEVVSVDLVTGIETPVLSDWGPGVNSLAYYEVVVPQPSCFYRRYGVLENGTWVYLSDHYISDFSQRIIVGDVNCCECSCNNGVGESPSVEFPEAKTVSGFHAELSGTNNIGFIGTPNGPNIRSITVNVIAGEAIITDSTTTSIRYPRGSYTWSATGDNELTNGLLRAVATDSPSSRVIVHWTQYV